MTFTFAMRATSPRLPSRRRQVARIGQRERLNRKGALPAKAEGLATRDKKSERRCGCEQLADRAGRRKNLLEVVENEQNAMPIGEVGDGFQWINPARRRGAQHARDRRESKCWVPGSGEVDESHRVEALVGFAQASCRRGR